MTAELLIEENGYTIQRARGQEIIEFKTDSKKISIVFFAVSGVFIILLSTIFTSIVLCLFGIGLTIWSFVKQGWSNPTSVIIDNKKELIHINTGIFNRHTFLLESIASLEVDERVLTRDVSPFKEGYQDFHYHLGVIIGKKRFNLMHFEYEEESEDKIRVIVDYLSKVLLLARD